jgi:ComF family protein
MHNDDILGKPIDINGLGSAVNHGAPWQVYIRSIFDHISGRRRCVLCQGVSDLTGFCVDCSRELPRVGVACIRCGLPLPVMSTCGVCLRSPPPFDAVRAAYWYQAPVATLIHQLKYDGKLNAARVLGHSLAQAFTEGTSPWPDAIVPVPLHDSRLRQRGFNQSIELIRTTAKQLGVPLFVNGMERVRVTQEQAKLPASQRRRNVRGVFTASPKEYRQVKTVALFDDVMTTGHTVAEATRALKAAGVERVVVWLCARATSRWA